MMRILGRIGRFARARPWRSGVVAAVVVLLLIGAVIIALPRNGIESAKAPAESSGQGAPSGEAPTTSGALPGAGAGSAGGTDSTASPGTGGGTGSTASPGADEGSGGAGTSSASGGARTQPGASAPSAADGTAGDLTPVEPRTPVRCAPTGAPSTGALPPADEREGRRWVTVGRLTGNCDASSAAFTLQGIDTRLAWRSDADSFAVFVVDVVQGREATAGFADGQCAGTCSESQSIVPAAGSYRLEVQAGDGPWEVEIQEYRRP